MTSAPTLPMTKTPVNYEKETRNRVGLPTQ